MAISPYCPVNKVPQETWYRRIGVSGGREGALYFKNIVVKFMKAKEQKESHRNSIPLMQCFLPLSFAFHVS